MLSGDSWGFTHQFCCGSNNVVHGFPWQHLGNDINKKNPSESQGMPMDKEKSK